MNSQKIKLLVVDDEDCILSSFSDYLMDFGYSVETAKDGNIALNLINHNLYDLVIMDLILPDIDGITLLSKVRTISPNLPIIIITGHGTMQNAIECLRLGAADFLRKPIRLHELEKRISKCLKFNKPFIKKEKHIGFGKRSSSDGYLKHNMEQEMVAMSSSMKKVEKQILLAVERNCDTILIYGETGTGKEVVATQIHALTSKKADHPFIAVSCPAITDTLFENELFGHEKGAYTGAISSQPGHFERANNGTLFLDEISDLSLTLQAKLLRALESRHIRRVGGFKEIPVNVRLIAATNAPLENLVETGQFRADLLYRLNVFYIHLLPLRERPEDIIPIAENFLSIYCSQNQLKINGFSPEAANILMNYHYPGNIRELRNIVAHSTYLCNSDIILPKHLPIHNDSKPDNQSPKSKPPEKSQQKSTIIEALNKTRWNRREAARILGIPYSTLRYRMLRLGIK